MAEKEGGVKTPRGIQLRSQNRGDAGQMRGGGGRRIKERRARTQRKKLIGLHGKKERRKKETWTSRRWGEIPHS